MAGAIQIDVRAMRYPDSLVSTNLIQDFSLDVPSGEFVSLLGRTGVGKTTLLRILAGLEKRYTGKILLDRGPLTRPSRTIQLVFQDIRLLPWKTVRENIAFATRDPKDAGENRRVDYWLDTVGMRHRADAWPKYLSGGEETRVAFARALVGQPKVLLLDEPFRGLDIRTRYSLQDELVSALRANPTTVVMVSHSIEDAVFLSDTIVVLSEAPMRIERSFDIELPRPRERGSHQLAELEAAVIRHIGAKQATPGGEIAF